MFSFMCIAQNIPVPRMSINSISILKGINILSRTFITLYKTDKVLNIGFSCFFFYTEGVDFAYWWSCIGKGVRLQPAQQACLLNRTY